MGKKILPILCDGGLDIDYEWQVPQISYLLKKMKKSVDKFVNLTVLNIFKFSIILKK